MANSFFKPGEQRAEKVKELFTGIAPRYDLLNDLQSFGLHRRWKRHVIRLCCVKPGESALDVCCGTGDITLGLSRAGAQAVGVDFNESMLEVARKRAERGHSGGRSVIGGTPASQASTLSFVRADAQNLPYPDSSFDIVTIGYGLRNLASWETGLREMQRVARPGARLVALEFGKPDLAVWRGLYFGYLKFAVPLLGRMFCRNAEAYSYILESLKYYPGQRGVAAKMTELGFASVRVFNLLGGAMSINCCAKPPSRTREA